MCQEWSYFQVEEYGKYSLENENLLSVFKHLEEQCRLKPLLKPAAPTVFRCCRRSHLSREVGFPSGCKVRESKTNAALPGRGHGPAVQSGFLRCELVSC